MWGSPLTLELAMANTPYTNRSVLWFLQMIEQAKAHGRFRVPGRIDKPLRQFILLERNCQNRRVRRDNIARIYELMRAGDWLQPGPGSLMMCTDGQLGQGQHRLLAAERLDFEFDAWIEFGVPPEDAAAADELAPWGAQDHVYKMGYGGVSNHMAAAAKIIINALEKAPWSSNKPSKAKLTHWMPKLVNLRDDVLEGKNIARGLGSPPSPTSAALWFIRTTTGHPELLPNFTEQIKTGVGWWHEDCPARWLRKGFEDKRWSGVRATAAIINAWNLEVRRKTANRPKLDPSSAFPTAL